MKKYFYLDTTPICKDKYVIRMNHELFPFPTGITGSYNVLIARILNLSYANFLRYARDRLGADLIGKGEKYIVPYFDNTDAVKQLVKLLNKRMEYIISERNDPFEYWEEEDGNIIRIPFSKDEDND